MSDVARVAGVAAQTVSRVLPGHPNVAGVTSPVRVARYASSFSASRVARMREAYSAGACGGRSEEGRGRYEPTGERSGPLHERATSCAHVRVSAAYG